MSEVVTPPVNGEGAPPANPAVDALNQPPADAWYGKIDDPELKGWVENKKFADPVTALKSQRELEKMLGTDRISVPGKDEPLESWPGWDKIGVPKEAKAFAEAVKMPELPEGMQLDEGLVTKAFELGAAKRIPVQHMQEMVNLFAEHQLEGFKAAGEIDAADRKAVDDLYANWGTAKAQNLEQGRRAAAALGLGDDFISEASQIKGSANLIAKLAEIGAKLGEGGIIIGGNSGVSPDQAKAELDAMKADPATVQIMFDPQHPSHQSTKERFEKLSLASLSNG